MAELVLQYDGPAERKHKDSLLRDGPMPDHLTTTLPSSSPMRQVENCTPAWSGYAIRIRTRLTRLPAHLHVAPHDICKHLADFVMGVFPPRKVRVAGADHWPRTAGRCSHTDLGRAAV